MSYFSKVVATVLDENESKELMRTIRQCDYLFQVHDSINDLFNSKKVMKENYVELKSDILVMVRDLSGQTLDLFGGIQKDLSTTEKVDVHARSNELQEQINEANKELFKMLSDPLRHDVGTLTNFITYSQRLKDKLLNFYKVKEGSRAAFEMPAQDTDKLLTT
jgi:phosphate:Na+ symporter